MAAHVQHVKRKLNVLAEVISVRLDALVLLQTAGASSEEI